MSFGLLCTVADFIPKRFLRDKLVKLVPKIERGVESICRDWKAIVVRQYLTKGGSANSAETSAIFVRRNRLVECDVLPPPKPSYVFSFDKDHGARPNLAAPGAMTGAHHRWLCQKLKLYRVTATASHDHLRSLSARKLHQSEQ